MTSPPPLAPTKAGPLKGRSPRPLVSIGMPVYNGERFIRQAVESILAQDYKDFELIISDNASTDGTGGICQGDADRDARVRYVHNDVNIGACLNHKRVFEMGRGDYFKWAAHDDECLPTFLARCMETFEEAPRSVVLVYPQSLLIDGEGRPMGEYWDVYRGEGLSTLLALGACYKQRNTWNAGLRRYPCECAPSNPLDRRVFFVGLRVVCGIGHVRRNLGTPGIALAQANSSGTCDRSPQIDARLCVVA